MDPVMRHKEESPTCSFVRGFLRRRDNRANLVVQSQPVSPQVTFNLQQLQSSELTLQHTLRSRSPCAVVTGLAQGTSAFRPPDYSDQATRLQSFKYWGGVLPIEKLAEAGFYMIARRDVVRCFSCHVVLQDWEKTDNVIDKHLRCSPNCPFLRKLLYNDMITGSLPTSAGFVIDPSDSYIVPTSASMPLSQLSSPFAMSPSVTVPHSFPSSRANSLTQTSSFPPNLSGQYWKVGEMQLASFTGPQQHRYANDMQVLAVI